MATWRILQKGEAPLLLLGDGQAWLRNGLTLEKGGHEILGRLDAADEDGYELIDDQERAALIRACNWVDESSAPQAVKDGVAVVRVRLVHRRSPTAG